MEARVSRPTAATPLPPTLRPPELNGRQFSWRLGTLQGSGRRGVPPERDMDSPAGPHSFKELRVGLTDRGQGEPWEVPAPAASCQGQETGAVGRTGIYRYRRRGPCLGLSGPERSSSVWKFLVKNSSRADVKEPVQVITTLAPPLQVTGQVQ